MSGRALDRGLANHSKLGSISPF